MIEKTKKRLGELLVEDGILSRERLEEALQHQKKQGGMIGQLLVRLGFISEEELTAALGKQLRIPYLPLSNYSVNFEVVLQFQEDFCRSHLVIAFDQDEKFIFLSTADPLNDSVIQEIEKQVSLKPQVFISTPTEILNMLDLAFNTSAAKAKKAG